MKDRVEAHWDYFLILESDLIDVFTVIEPCHENYGVFGPVLAKLFLSVCMEVDAVLHDLMDASGRSASSEKQSFSMKDYESLIVEEFDSEFDCVEVLLLGTDVKVEPWSEWWEDGQAGRVRSGSHLDWWRAYNQVKHNRIENYRQANLINLVNAFAALFVSIACLARTVEGEHYLRCTRITNFADEIYGGNQSASFEVSEGALSLNGTSRFVVGGRRAIDEATRRD